MKYGLAEKTVENICAVFASFPEIEKAILYGSRAKGNFKTGSDIDLTLCGEALTSDLRSTIASELDDLLLPYVIDLSIFDELNHAKLRDHIKRVGVVFYERANQGVGMKEGWEEKKLGECFKLKSGNNLTSKMMTENGKYPVYGGNGIAGMYDNFNLSGSNIIVGRVGALCGNVRYIKDKIWLTDNAFKITDWKYDFDHAFLAYLLNFKNLRGYARQAAQPVISNSSLEGVLLQFPKSKEEQKRIVAILDKAFDAINKTKANAEKNLQNARELFESYLQGVFANPDDGWEICNIEDYIKFIDYRGRTPQKTETGLRLITAKNVKRGYLQLEPQEFINPDAYDAWMTRGIPKLGDVIFTTEAPLANVAQLDTKEKVAFAQRIIVMQPQENKINQTFLKYILLSSPIRQKILAKGTGATVQGIKARLLKKIEIYFPSTIMEQRRIVTKLDELSAETKKLEAIYQQKLADLEELKKSILQKAFNGELN
ncbi:MAG: hypothetical protein FVQ84_06480 [Planctomycetes bacterium]|nr:hypothetical protein [Planctomycetota bacterium]